MKKIISLIFQVFVFSVLSALTFAQDCKPPEIVFNNNDENIFTEEQEMYLGEAMAQQVQKDFRIIEDEEINRYVRNIGNKITRHLTATNLKFELYVVDLPVVNAFAMAGGKIYLTRKLIAFVKNEDELAGIIAHELGHGIVRHGTIDMSRYFKEILGVKEVGDRNDIFEKYNQFLDNRNTKRINSKRSHQGKQQIEADNIGVFAMSAAGYNPKYFSSAFDRLAGTKGKTGSWFSDLFGATSLGEKRLREIINAVEQLPAECIDKNSNVSSKAFEDWRTLVISYSNYSGNERISGLMRRKVLNPTLRDDINHLEFSPDGKYIIAQDDSSIFVLQKEPYKFLFRIDSPEANNASFTPDSKSVVFNTPTLRVEKWDVLQQRPTFVREVFVTDDCFQTAISKDGNVFVCFSFDVSRNNLYVDMKMIDVRTNEAILEKKRFFRPYYLDYIQFSILSRFDDDLKMFQTEFSPDGRYFVAGRVFKNEERSQSISVGITVRRDAKAGKAGIIGYDLLEKKEMEIGEKLRDIIVSPFTFLTNDKIIGQDRKDEKKSGIFAFPSGQSEEQFIIKGDSFSKSQKGNYVMIRPLKTAPVGVYDLTQKKIIIANKTSAFDVYGDVFISENKAGELGLYSLKDDKLLGLVELPESRFGSIRALSVSPDLNWLAISDKNRGAVWSLFSGNQFFYVQGFRGAFFDSDGKVYSDFVRTQETKRQIAVMDLRTKDFVSSKELNTLNTKQYEKYLVTVKINKKDGEKRKKSITIIDDSILKGTEVNNGDESVSKNGIMEVRDVRSEKLLWSKEFPNEVPKQYVSSINNTISLIWKLESEAAAESIKNDENLSKIASTMGDKESDYLVQVFEAETGKPLGQTLIETGEGSFRIIKAEAVGDWLAAVDSQNRVLFYSLKDGELKQRFFGENFTINKENNTVAVGNLSGQLVIYDLNSGRNLESMKFDSPIAYAQFDKYGKKLLVLTAKQEAMILDVSKFSQPGKLAVKLN